MLENPRRKRPIACSRASMRSVPASRGRHKLLSARCTNLFSSRKSQRWSHPAPTGPLHTTNGDRLTAYPSKGVNTTVCTNIYFIRLGSTRGSMGFNSSLAAARGGQCCAAMHSFLDTEGPLLPHVYAIGRTFRGLSPV